MTNFLTYLLSFVGVWVGSGIAIKAVERLSGALKTSKFTTSFLVLGLFTSIGELSVGINAIAGDDPEIFVGNLIGASIVIFMLIIPLLAIVGKSIHISNEFRGFNLPASLVVVALPVLLAMDGTLTKSDSFICMFLFVFLLFCVQIKKGILSSIKNTNHKSKAAVGKELIRILFGVAVIFIASKVVVEQTLIFSEILGVPPFLISLLFIAIGTNIPELSLVFRSVLMRSSQVAFGDYVGSASFNTFLLGILTFAYGKSVVLTNSYLVSLSFLIVGLLLFYYFARTKNSVSRREGFLLLLLYALFLFTEVGLHQSLLFWND